MSDTIRCAREVFRGLLFGLLAVVMSLSPLALRYQSVSALADAPEVMSYDENGALINQIGDVNLSQNGRYIAFSDEHNGGGKDIYVRDRQTGVTTKQLPVAYDVRDFKLTADGAKLFFSAHTTELDPRITSTNQGHAYVKDLQTHQISLVSLAVDGMPSSTEHVASSDDGVYFSWECPSGTGGIYLCVRNLTQGQTISYPTNGGLVSGNARYILYKTLNQGNLGDFRRYDTQTGTDTFIASGDDRFLTGISYDGAFAVYKTEDVALYRLNLETGESELVNVGINGHPFVSTFHERELELSGNGMMVVFTDYENDGSFRGGLPFRLYTHNFETDEIKEVSVNAWGNRSDYGVQEFLAVKQNVVSFDGSEIAFISRGSNLGCSHSFDSGCGYVAPTAGPEVQHTDTVIPTVSEISPDTSTKAFSDTLTFTLPASDDNSGVSAGEFYLTDNNAITPSFTVITFPEAIRNGRGTPMTYSDGVLTGVVGNDVPAGEYTIRAYAQDVAGNWSEQATAQLVVTGGEPQSVSLSPLADTYVRSGQSNHNQGGSQFMQIQSSGSNRGLVRFDQGSLQSMVGGGTVLSAKLRLTITDNGDNWGATGRTVDVHRLLSDWAEGNGTENDRGTGTGATWSCVIDNLIQNQAKDCSGSSQWEMGQPNNPSVHPWFATPTATQTINNGQSGVVEYDVTGDVQAFLSGAHANYGWLIKKTNEGQNGQVSFGTRESQFAPELVITYQL
jgi:hypothetical protein